MPNTKIYLSTVEASNRLHDLGLTITQIRSIAEAMAAARASSTDNDPSSAPGLFAWIRGVRRMREVLLPEGWERENTDQVPTVANYDYGVRLTVMNTDNGTGIVESSPQPCSKKGVATERAAFSNQKVFSEIMETASNTFPLVDAQDSSEIIQWYICVYSDADVTRVEVSCPVSLTGGLFTSFEERIFVSLDNGGAEPSKIRKPGPDSTPEYDIQVTRKKA